VFKSGDWWVFAARTADASVEPLAHARRAASTITAKPACTARQPAGRLPPFWPPSFGGDSACTVCVSPQAHARSAPSLQQAIDSVVAQGETVCLEIGDYELRAPLPDRRRTHADRAWAGSGDTPAAPATTSIAISKASDITLGDSRSRVPPVHAGELSAITVDSTGACACCSSRGSSQRQFHQRRHRARTSSQTCALRQPDWRAARIISASGRRPKRGPITMQSMQVEGNLFNCATAAIDLQLNADCGRHCRCCAIASAGQQGRHELRGTGIADGGIEVAGNRLDVSGSGIAVGVPGAHTRQ
jgi:hypothetical protein